MKNQNFNYYKPSFEQHLKDGEIGGEQMFDWNRKERLSKLQAEYDKRSGYRDFQPDRALSPQFVVQQAAERYFDLLNEALSEIQEIFTEEEIRIVLECTNSPVLSIRGGASFVKFLTDEYGIQSVDDVKDGGTLKLLLLKLLDLGTLQSLALGDVCEIYWRNPQSGSLSEICENIGLKLAEEA